MRGAQTVRSLAPPSLEPQTAGAVLPAYGSGGVIYGSVGGDADFAVRAAPQAAVADHDSWAGPVLPDELARERRRLSREERLRLRSDIRDVSRNMYEQPRGRH